MRTSQKPPRSRLLPPPFFVIASLAMLALAGGARVANAGISDTLPMQSNGGSAGLSDTLPLQSNGGSAVPSGSDGFCCYDAYSGSSDTAGECEEGWTEAACKDNVEGKLWNGDKPLCDFMCGKMYKFYYCDPATYTCSENRPQYAKDQQGNYIDADEIRRGYKYGSYLQAISFNVNATPDEACMTVCKQPTIELKATGLCSEKDPNDRQILPTEYAMFYIDFPTRGEQESNYNSTPGKLRYEDLQPGTMITFTVDRCFISSDFLTEPFTIDHLSWQLLYRASDGKVVFQASSPIGQESPSYWSKELARRFMEVAPPTPQSRRMLFTMPVRADGVECMPGEQISSEAEITLPSQGGLGESPKTIRSEVVSYTITGCGCSVCEKCMTENGEPCDYSGDGPSTCVSEEPYARYCRWTMYEGSNDPEREGYCRPDPDNDVCDYIYACCKRKPSVTGNSSQDQSESRLQSSLLTAQAGDRIIITTMGDVRIDYPDNDNRYVQGARRDTYINREGDYFNEAKECQDVVAITASDEAYGSADESADATAFSERVATIKEYCAQQRSVDLWCDRRLTNTLASCYERVPDDPNQSPRLGTVMFVPPFYNEISGVTYDESEGRTLQCGAEFQDAEADENSYCESQRNMGLCCRRPGDGCVTMSVDECNPQGTITPFSVVGGTEECEIWEDAGACE